MPPNKYGYSNRRLENDGLSVAEVIEKLKSTIAQEFLYFFKNKRQIARFEGQTDNVSLSRNDMLLANNALVLHNHPLGTSFSIEDVANAVSYNVAEMQIVTTNVLYGLVRPHGKWPFSFELLPDHTIGSDSLTKAQFEEAQALADEMGRKSEVRGEISSSEKILLENHYLWTVFFHLKGITYAERKI